MKERIKRIICIIVHFTLLISVPYKTLAQNYQTVRVLLTNINAEQRLHIGVYGSYSADGKMSFQRASEIVVSVENGAMMLYHEGMAYHAGKSLSFIRHQSAGVENGLRLQHGLQLYEGDLHLTLQDNSIRPVLHIAVEDYLKGVVPYEMNESFPFEALKAQAIAARTYALRNLDASMAYDVVDNTNDQVYRGHLSQNVNAARAIQDTQGICGVFGGSFAHCYYTASNGGQTQSPKNVWGGGDVSYLPIQDDPYDLANPESIVREAIIEKKNSEHFVGNQQLTEMLKLQLQPLLERKGYNPDIHSFYIDEVEAVNAVTPRFGGNSKVMTEMEFVLYVGAQQRSRGQADQEISLFATPEPTAALIAHMQEQWLPAKRLHETFSVRIPVFPDAESALQLSININQNEILQVENLQDSFKITMRRYGHGVGMSQRGAQQMAQAHGWTYQQILSFYYPGMELKQYDTVSALATEIPAHYLSTPGPIPTATPRPTLMPVSMEVKDGQYLVTVTGVATNSTLNLRNQPGMAGDVVMQLFYGQELLVMGKTEDGWLQVKTDAAEGYVMERFVHVKE